MILIERGISLQPRLETYRGLRHAETGSERTEKTSCCQQPQWSLERFFYDLMHVLTIGR